MLLIALNFIFLLWSGFEFEEIMYALKKLMKFVFKID